MDMLRNKTEPIARRLSRSLKVTGADTCRTGTHDFHKFHNSETLGEIVVVSRQMNIDHLLP